MCQPQPSPPEQGPQNESRTDSRAVSGDGTWNVAMLDCCQSVGHQFGVEKSTVDRAVVTQVCRAINHLLPGRTEVEQLSDAF